MQNRDIVVVGLQPWDIEIGSNCKNIALELARKNRVLYVNRALDRISSIRLKNDPKIQERKKSLKGQVPDLLQKQENLWVLNPRTVMESTNWMPKSLFRHFNRINNSRLAKQILKSVERLNFNNLVLFIDNDFFRAYHLPEMLKANLSIYYIRDYLIDQPYFKKHGRDMEKGLMSKVDLIAANSPYLADYGRQFNSNSYYIGQGCDFSFFSEEISFEKPQELKNLKGPVIGYVGALIGSRLNISLLFEIASLQPTWNIVLVGPEDLAFSESGLHDLPNVHFAGRKEPADLPAFINYFDVCLNPQLINQLTIGNYPRKVDEYLALGKPVVATKTPFMELFKSYVYLCVDSKDYIAAIETALLENSLQKKEARQKFALSHTWENSVNELYSACKALSPHKHQTISDE